jgi:restriction system protein
MLPQVQVAIQIAQQAARVKRENAAFVARVLAERQQLLKAATLIAQHSAKVSLSLSGIVTPGEKLSSGLVVVSTSQVWADIVETLGTDWSVALQIPSDKWEEIVAGAFKKASFDEVILTPRSGDHGRDVIATKKGVLSIKIIGSVKRYKPDLLVGYDDVRALLGVLSGERDASKGIVMTTSDFPPNISDDPFIKPFLPTRLELLNGEQLRQWLTELGQSKRE